MSKPCPLFKTCFFLNAFRSHSEVIGGQWITTDCESSSPSAHCERRVLERKTGKAPAWSEFLIPMLIPNTNPNLVLLTAGRLQNAGHRQIAGSFWTEEYPIVAWSLALREGYPCGDWSPARPVSIKSLPRIFAVFDRTTGMGWTLDEQTCLNWERFLTTRENVVADLLMRQEA